MDYNKSDLKNIAKLLSGAGNVMLPELIVIDETALYECCYDMQLDTSILDNHEYQLDVFLKFLIQLAMDDKLVLFIDFYFNKYMENRIHGLTVDGYNVFLLKDKILTALNSLWSIRSQEFGIDNSKISMKSVVFKQYDKMGEGGFCTVYNCPEDMLVVYKVLNTVEKADVGSVHRFKREFDIMEKENDSGYTIKVFDYDSKALVYSMEKASISLEEYIETNVLKDTEKDEIIIRCAECMKYLHSKGVIHRDFHPGNILRNYSKEWMVTDFGLAKDISSRYSHQTTTTHAVGRAWFTDPLQLFALKDGNFRTDMFSLAKTIDYVVNANMSGTPHKYSSVVYKATASNPENRYESIEQMYEDLVSICGRLKYESPDEIIKTLLIQYDETKKFDVVQLVSLLNKDTEGVLMWNLVVEFGRRICSPFVSIINISFEIALREIRNVSSTMQASYHKWDDYDVVAYWAIGLINERKNANDEINIEAAKIIEYVASNVSRYDIKSASNSLKNNSSIDGHIRSELSYHEGY
ncbi:protein kinase domain-containing protein [Clostridium ganghwense]|uniref:non-specific serine/threonine protein kinase n=1 Tax=Clostridium ganghwense TaxID=312089 RepID=A0ABT4CQA1_9CLOT|nr:protein kinase [Clostridium ganghwense]MCY6371241.1 protein kinase [Clostridium ganghwense]